METPVNRHPLSVSVVREPGKDGRLRIEICPSVDLVAARGAELFLEGARRAILHRGRFTVALSGGSSPAPLFRRIAENASGSGIDWGKAHVFWVDERCVPPDHAESNYRLAREQLLDLLPSVNAVIHRIPGELSPREAARCYEEDLARSFPGESVPLFDQIWLGLGPDGHTASLFPGSEEQGSVGRTAVAVYVEKLRSHRVTLTLPVINNARRVIFLVTGAGKANIVAEILEGKEGTRYPAGHVAPTAGTLTWLLDADAGGGLHYP
jgi:6-phosphogluconolactonase